MCVCSIRSKNCSEERSAASQLVKSSSSKVDASTSGLSVQFMSPSGNKAVTDTTDDTVTSQRIANYTVASASASSSTTARKDKDSKDIL